MDELAKRFADLAEQYGPSVVHAAFAAARVEAISSLVSSMIAAGFAVAMIWAGKYLWKMKCKDEMDNSLAHAAGAVIIASAIIPGAIAIWNWIDPWTWTALFQPEVWIARKVLKL